jgi:hypothetical protein
VNSALTQTVSGQAKDVVVVLLGFALFDDAHVDPINILGVVVGFGGSIFYAMTKIVPACSVEPLLARLGWIDLSKKTGGGLLPTYGHAVKNDSPRDESEGPHHNHHLFPHRPILAHPHAHAHTLSGGSDTTTPNVSPFGNTPDEQAARPYTRSGSGSDAHVHHGLTQTAHAYAHGPLGMRSS